MKTTDTGVKPSTREAGSLTPAYMEGKQPGADISAAPVFANPIEGYTDTGVTHQGDSSSLNKQ